MPGPNSAPNGNVNLVNAHRIRVCKVHGKRINQCAKDSNNNCYHYFKRERTYLGKNVNTGKTAMKKK